MVLSAIGINYKRAMSIRKPLLHLCKLSPRQNLFKSRRYRRPNDNETQHPMEHSIRWNTASDVSLLWPPSCLHWLASRSSAAFRIITFMVNIFLIMGPYYQLRLLWMIQQSIETVLLLLLLSATHVKSPMNNIFNFDFTITTTYDLTFTSTPNKTDLIFKLFLHQKLTILACHLMNIICHALCKSFKWSCDATLELGSCQRNLYHVLLPFLPNLHLNELSQQTPMEVLFKSQASLWVQGTCDSLHSQNPVWSRLNHLTARSMSHMQWEAWKNSSQRVLQTLPASARKLIPGRASSLMGKSKHFLPQCLMDQAQAIEPWCDIFIAYSCPWASAGDMDSVHSNQLVLKGLNPQPLQVQGMHWTCLMKCIPQSYPDQE